MSSGKVFKFDGSRATVSWHGRLCIHVGECGRAKGDLFVAGRKPWCQPDTSSDDEVEEVVLRCPTGALTVDYEDGTRPEKADAENSVHVAYNGPLFMRGDLEIAAAPENAPGLNFRAALCRCGKSRNKPYCDNSHEKAGFSDYGAVGEKGDSTSQAGGALSIQPIKDGPLACKGNVTIYNSSGRATYHGNKAFLCRCGASENKPFCDGAHKKIGFESD
ncbi:MAG: CDGSH iron-sulfur domain-containing protein [Woeseiaceae bacterium]